MYCQPLAATDSLQPSSGQDLGGQAVYVTGYNFANSSSYYCKFGTAANVPAVRVSSTQLRCISPVSPPECTTAECSVRFYLIENSTTVPYGNTLYFLYRAACPDSLCGFGVCSRGQCNCLPGWTGARCNITVIPVTIPALAAITMIEGRAYTNSTPLPATGSAPIIWSLVSITPYASQLTLSVDGLISWATPVASTTPYVMTVRASNALNAVTTTITINVPPSYSASVRVVGVDGSSVSASDARVVRANGYVTLYGSASSAIAGVTSASVPLTLWIRRADVVVAQPTVMTMPGGLFQYYYTLTPSMSGRWVIERICECECKCECG